MIIHTYEKGGRGRACADYLYEKSREIDLDEIIVLPIPTTRDNKYLKDSEIPLDDIVKMVRRGVFVIGYSLPKEFSERLIERGAYVFDAGLDENFLTMNAELTALCTLGILLTTSERVPSDLKFGIVGYGRIGKKLTEELLFLGADVRVYTSRDNMRLELCEFGVASSMSTKNASFSGIDILINTAPAVIFDASSIPDGLRVIDLASGNNFPFLESYERYPSIPAKMFPISSGRALAAAALSHLSRVKD